MSAIHSTREGWLPEPHSAVWVRVEPFGCRAGASVTYRGRLEPLLSAGCVTAATLQGRRKGVLNLDEHGMRSAIHRLPTKAMPDRLEVVRRLDDSALALALPGVRELFPEGLPAPESPTVRSAPEVTESKDPTPSSPSAWLEHARDWLDFATGFLGDNLKHELANVDGRFRVSDADAKRIEQLAERLYFELDAVLESSTVIDTRRPPLRLVVNNVGPPSRPVHRATDRRPRY